MTPHRLQLLPPHNIHLTVSFLENSQLVVRQLSGEFIGDFELFVESPPEEGESAIELFLDGVVELELLRPVIELLLLSSILLEVNNLGNVILPNGLYILFFDFIYELVNYFIIN